MACTLCDCIGWRNGQDPDECGRCQHDEGDHYGTKPAGDVSERGWQKETPLPEVHHAGWCLAFNGKPADCNCQHGESPAEQYAAGMAAAVERLEPWIQHEERCFYRNGLQVRCTCGLTAALEAIRAAGGYAGETP